MFAKRELPEFLRVPWNAGDVALLIGMWFGLQLLLGIVLAIAKFYIPVVAQFLVAVNKGDVGASFTLDLVGVVLGFALVAGYLRHYHVGWGAVGWRKVNIFKALGYLAAVFVGFVILAQIAFIVVKLLFPGFDANQPQTNDITQNASSHRSLALVALVLLPPIFEETIFRGFIFPALAKRAGLIWGAVLSSMIFGLAHGQANLFVYTSILGLLLCLMYVRTKSIIPGIMLHMVNNYLAFLAITSK